VAGYYHGTVSDTVIFNKDTLINDGTWPQIFITKLKTRTVLSAEEQTNIFNSENLFQIYPNPNSGMFTIISKENNNDLKVCIYDLNGRCVLSKMLASLLPQ